MPVRDSLSLVAADVQACTLCPLHASRIQGVPGEGSSKPGGILVLGEAPGSLEDTTGRPFVGRSGQLLRKTLTEAGILPESVFITSTLKSRPPANRDPLPTEVEACRPYLTRQLKLLKPALIVVLGRVALARFVPKVKISQVHGTLLESGKHAIYPVFHPAAALRDPSRLRDFQADIARLPQVLKEAQAR